MNALLAKADGISGKAQRFTLYGQVLKIVGSDVPYVMLDAHTDDLALSSKFNWPGLLPRQLLVPWLFDIGQQG